MRTVFYSTSTNIFRDGDVTLTNLMSHAQQFRNFTQSHPDDDFFAVTQQPGMFMPEKELSGDDPRIIYARQDDSTDEIAQIIAGLRPDIAIAMTFWVAPFDWLAVSDALVAERLRGMGISVICNSVETALICFDKNRTREFFERNGIPSPRTILVDHDLFFCAASGKEVLHNAYRNSVLAQVRTMRLPLVIKDTTGLSAYSLGVAGTYGEAEAYLTSKRNNSNRIVQEYAHGMHLGVEVYGAAGRYTVLPPFVFSLSKYGITSARHSVKFCAGGKIRAQENSGKISGTDFPDLEDLVLGIARKLDLQGAAQIDLVLERDKWTVIEINPRLSGMSLAYAAGARTSVFEMIFSASRAMREDAPENPPLTMRPTLSIKLPPQSKDNLAGIMRTVSSDGHDLACQISQIHDSAARQERERGYCEIILSGDEDGIAEAVSKLIAAGKS